MKKACEFCGVLVDPDDRQTYRMVVGWEKKRQSGGTNQLRLRRPREHYACMECIEIRPRTRVLAGQLELS